MKTFVVVVILLLVAAAGYAYNNNPAGCAKVGDDLVAIFQSMTTTPRAADQETNSPPVTPPTPAPESVATPAPKPATVPAAAPASPSPR